MKTKGISILCACLMVLLLVLQFVPYWQYGEEPEDVSIQRFVWFPTDCKGLEKQIGEEILDPGFSVGRIVLMPILELLLCAAGSVLCLLKGEEKWVSLFPVAAGGFGIWGYLNPAFRLGSLWTLHFAVCILLLAAGAFLAYIRFKEA